MIENRYQNLLTGSVMLSRNPDGSNPEEYRIKTVIGEGGSTVCYDAVAILPDGSVATGKLKEFYPVDFGALTRLPNGQLVCDPQAALRFRDLCREYLDAYRLLNRVIAEDPNNEVLKNYVQLGDTLYGCAPDGGTATVYIWSPGVLGTDFGTCLSQLRAKPERWPEAQLHDVLRVVETLTDFAKALHTAGLMHLDLNPRNFLVEFNSDHSIVPDRISVFDINTLCSVDYLPGSRAGTRGYCAPELMCRRYVDHHADIYSIGAILFSAIVITDDIPDGLYRSDHYSRLDQLVRHSRLLQASETNSDAALRMRLCRILQKCLAPHPEKRYECCADLQKDLRHAISRLEEMLAAPADTAKEGLTDPEIVLQKLLYTHPLFEAVPPDAREINVLVLGAGTYGQKWIDQCLQSCQMPDVMLNITAVSDDAAFNRSSYLRFRPALPEFVDVDGALRGTAAPYARVSFLSISDLLDGSLPCRKFTARASSTNAGIIDALCELARRTGRPWNYVFIALGSDTLNRTVSRMIAQKLLEPCPVCWVTQKKPGAKPDGMSFPVWLNEPLTLASAEDPLGEMAFHVHLSWNSALRSDIERARHDFFEDPSMESVYQRRSSLAYVLSLRYKLHSVGIPLDDPREAGQAFERQILRRMDSDADARRRFHRLVIMEHRRWILEKAIDGWTAPRNADGSLRLEECILRGSVKDHANRTHPCIVRASDPPTLSSPEYTKNDREKWDLGPIDPSLDELDRMSLELHRVFRRQAEVFRESPVLHLSDVNYISALIPAEYRSVQEAFRKFRGVLERILGGSEEDSRRYDHHHSAFLEAARALPPQYAEAIRRRMELIRLGYFPVVESNLYRDYKAYDAALIESIPFILSHRYTPVPTSAGE